MLIFRVFPNDLSKCGKVLTGDRFGSQGRCDRGYSFRRDNHRDHTHQSGGCQTRGDVFETGIEPVRRMFALLDYLFSNKKY